MPSPSHASLIKDGLNRTYTKLLFEGCCCDPVLLRLFEGYAIHLARTLIVEGEDQTVQLVSECPGFAAVKENAVNKNAENSALPN